MESTEVFFEEVATHNATKRSAQDIIDEAKINNVGVKLYLTDGPDTMERCRRDGAYYLTKIIIYASVVVNGKHIRLNSTMTHKTLQKKILKAFEGLDNMDHIPVQSLVYRYMQAGLLMATNEKDRILDQADCRWIQEMHKGSTASYERALNAIKTACSAHPEITLEDLQQIWSDATIHRVMRT